MGNLDGKVALVTGAANKSSMGHAVALRLAREGASVAIADKWLVPQNLMSEDSGWKGLDAVSAEIKAIGREALVLVTDIANSQEVEAAIDKTVQKFGKIDIFVHCAGIRGSMTTPIVDLDEKEWKTVLDINLNGTFLLARAVAKSMIAKGGGGKILLVASMGGVKGMPGSAPYCVSKFGVIGLVKTLALELAKYNINVNAINPGAVTTNLRDNYYKEIAKAEGITIEQAREKHYQKSLGAIPLGRIGTPEEMANLILFLVSDQSSYITGEDINISGGIN
jgi:NAD(P)-dependent dehydrogenase (short-subunit alcohol dehydrogenase family)